MDSHWPVKWFVGSVLALVSTSFGGVGCPGKDVAPEQGDPRRLDYPPGVIFRARAAVNASPTDPPCLHTVGADEAEGYPRGRWRLARPSQLETVVLWVSHVLIRHEGARNADVSFSAADWHSVMEPSSRTKPDALALAQRVADLAQRDPERFPELAAAHSEDITTRDTGGSLGGVQAAQLQIWPQVLDALQALRAGEVSRPVETSYGFHVFFRAPVPERALVTGSEIVIGHEDARWLRFVGRDASTKGVAPSRSRSDARKLAETLFEEALARPDRFEDLVRQYSEHRSVDQGGDFGTWSNQEPSPFAREIEVLAGLPSGGVAAPLDTVVGFKVIARRPNRPRARYAMTAIHVPFGALSLSDSISQPAALVRATALADSLAADPGRFEQLQRQLCCAGVEQWHEGRGNPGFNSQLARLSIGEMARHPMLAASAYLIPKRLEPVADPPSQFDLPAPAHPDIDFVLASLPAASALAVLRAAHRKALAIQRLDGSGLVRHRELEALLESPVRAQGPRISSKYLMQLRSTFPAEESGVVLEQLESEVETAVLRGSEPCL
jgi:hypothetical protein